MLEKAIVRSVPCHATKWLEQTGEPGASETGSSISSFCPGVFVAPDAVLCHAVFVTPQSVLYQYLINI